MNVQENVLKIVAAGCFHYPRTAWKEFKRWLQFLEVFKPNKIFLTGGLIHSEHSLRALTGPRLERARNEMKEVLLKFREEILVKIRVAAGKAEIFYLEGPCERNIREWCEHQELDFKTEILETLNLEELEIKYIPEGKMRFKKFLFTAGKYTLKKSVFSAKAELDEQGVNGCSSVSHHVASYFQTNYRGQLVWHEIGCICDDKVNEPKKVRSSDYSERGCLIGFFLKEKNRFDVRPIKLTEEVIIKKRKRKFVFFDPALPHSKKGDQVEVKIGCGHLPYLHRSSFSSCLDLIERIKPRKIHLLGDFLDFPQFSQYVEAQHPNIQASLKKDINKAKKVLKMIREIAPNAIIVYWAGNHEDRFRKYLLEKAPSFYDSLCIEKMLGLKELNIKYVKGRGGRKEFSHLTIHGDFVRKDSGKTAAAELEAKGISGDSAHSHRLGKFCKTNATGTFEWNEVGCLCIYGMPYIQEKKPNWQRGLGVTYINQIKGTREVKTFLVPIINGEIFYLGQMFKGKK